MTEQVNFLINNSLKYMVNYLSRTKCMWIDITFLSQRLAIKLDKYANIDQLKFSVSIV